MPKLPPPPRMPPDLGEILAIPKGLKNAGELNQFGYIDHAFRTIFEAQLNLKLADCLHRDNILQHRCYSNGAMGLRGAWSRASFQFCLNSS